MIPSFPISDYSGIVFTALDNRSHVGNGEGTGNKNPRPHPIPVHRVTKSQQDWSDLAAAAANHFVKKCCKYEKKKK